MNYRKYNKKYSQIVYSASYVSNARGAILVLQVIPDKAGRDLSLQGLLTDVNIQ